MRFLRANRPTGVGGLPLLQGGSETGHLIPPCTTSFLSIYFLDYFFSFLLSYVDIIGCKHILKFERGP